MNPLKKEITQAQRKHIQYLIGYYFGKFLTIFGYGGLHPLADLTAMLTIPVRLIMILVLVMVEANLFYDRVNGKVGIIYATVCGVVTYVLLHIMFQFLGTKLHKHSEEKLEDLESDCQMLCNKYKFIQEQSRGILNGQMEKDGITVANNCISCVTNLGADFGEIDIFLLEKSDDYFEYSKRESNPDKMWSAMAKNVASTQFNKVFGVTTEYGNERRAMIYLSPTRQLKMVQTPEMRKFTNMEVGDFLFTANTGQFIAKPPRVNIYSVKPLQMYFHDIDKYCEKFEKMCHEVYKDAKQINFMYSKV